MITRDMIAQYGDLLLGPTLTGQALAKFDKGCAEYGETNHLSAEFDVLQEALEEALDLFCFGAVELARGGRVEVSKTLIEKSAQAARTLTVEMEVQKYGLEPGD